jgi:hypothetical protein
MAHKFYRGASRNEEYQQAAPPSPPAPIERSVFISPFCVRLKAENRHYPD